MSEQPLPGLPRLRSPKRAPGPVEADPSGAFWKGIEPVLLRDTVTGENARQSTRVRTTWSDAKWHVLFEMEDALPWATFTSRESPLWEEEVVEVFFDPVGDLESYFEIEINSLGTVKDLVLRRTASGWRKEFAWTVEGLESRVQRTATGWTAEMAIPFEALGAVVLAMGTAWRANFLRIDRPHGPCTDADLSAWSPTGIRQFHRAERFGFVEFVE
jgi:hypothetical protein